MALLRDGRAISALHGSGHTLLTSATAGGATETSRGDALDITFAPTASAKAVKKLRHAADAGSEAGALESAVQQGNVELVQMQPENSRGTTGTRTTGTADRARFDMRSGTVRLDGGQPRLQNDSGELAAKEIVFVRGSGDVEASGEVKASYNDTGFAQAPGRPTGATPAPVHVVAAKASLNHAQDVVTFIGVGADARLWQGANSITAPTIVLNRRLSTLTAHGMLNPQRERPDAVHAVFVSTGVAGGIATTDRALSPVGGADARRTGAGQLVQVTSRSLTYSGGERLARFSGQVTAKDGDASIRAGTLDLLLNGGGPEQKDTGEWEGTGWR